MNPCFAILDDKLLVIAGTDPHLNVYDIKTPHQLLDRKPIAYPNYQMGDGEDRALADPKSIAYDESAGRTHSLKVYKDYLITTYSPGYDVADKEKYKTFMAREDYKVFKEKIAGKYPPAIMVMDHQGEAIQSISLPDNLDHRQFLVCDGALWWLSKFNSEIEEDFVQIYKVEIIRK